MRMVARAVALAAVCLLAGAGSAAGQALPPSLTADTNYAFDGVVEHDFTPGVVPDVARGAAIDSALDRHYALGATEIGGDLDVAVLARRGNGAFDTSFAGDGSLALDLAPGAADTGAALVVLPDHRLRIVATVGTAPTRDVAVVGLLADGMPDTSFGVAGRVTASLPADDVAAGIALDGAGRLALTGMTSTLGADDTFVAVLEPNGSPAADFGTAGVAVRDAGNGLDDTGVDVAWRSTGPVALIELAGGVALHAFTSAGGDDASFSGDGNLPIDAGGTDTTAGGIVLYGGRIFLTGSVEVGTDMDAYLARVEPDGSGLQVRRFDMRGGVFPASQTVDSVGRDLTLAPGEPDTLVVGGSAFTDSGLEVGAAAFNLLDLDLGALQFTELVVPVEGQGAAVGVAAGANGVVALATTDEDFSRETNSGTHDFGIGMARMLVDAEKRCDLGLSIVTPLELNMRGLQPSTVTLRARNGGQRACGGTIGVPAPYALTPSLLETGKLSPGASVTLTPSIAYAAPLPADDSLLFTLTSPTDAAPGDNVARLRVVFSFCDLELRAVERPRVLGFEGARRYGFTVRNAGTTACRGATIAVGGSGRRALLTGRYAVPAGQSVTDEVMVKARRRRVRPGARAPIAFTVAAIDDVSATNNRQAARPLVVRAGDSSARRPIKGGKLFTGTAKAARRTPGVRRSSLRVARVEIAVLKRGKGCRWLSAATGGLRRVPAGLARTCDQPVWIRARGTDRWRLRLRRALPKGRYTLTSRAVTRNGVPEGSFSFSDRNKVRFRIR